MENLESILKEHLFFKNLEKKYLKLIAGCSKNVRFAANNFIFKEGKSADKFYLIREGKVALQIPCQKKGALTIETLSDNEVLGFSWLFPPYKWSFDAKTIDNVRAFEIDAKCLRNKCNKDHELGYELQKRFSYIMAERLQATRIQLLDIYQSTSNTK